LHSRITLLDWLLYFLLALIWGSSFILIKTGLHYFDAFTVAALRITIAGIVLLPFAFSGLRQLSARDQFFSVLMGLCASGVPAFLFATGQTHVESGIAGIFNSLTPIFILINGWLFFRAKYSTLQTLGVVVGFVGCAGLILLTHKSHDTYDNNYWYALLLVLATFLYGMSNQILMHFLKGKSSMLITPVAFFYMGLMASVYLFATDFANVVQQNDAWKGLIYVALLAAFGSAFALLIYNYLAQRTGVAFSGTVTYVIPIFALMWSFADHEYIGWEHVAAMIVILFGVYLVRKPVAKNN
jgi:drug/metabolite transporter (DMT)-like permease